MAFNGKKADVSTTPAEVMQIDARETHGVEALRITCDDTSANPIQYRTTTNLHQRKWDGETWATLAPGQTDVIRSAGSSIRDLWVQTTTGAGSMNWASVSITGGMGK